MKIVIMGTGTMACLFGGRMEQHGHEVWLVTGWRAQAEKIAADGLRLIQKGHEDLLLHPHVTMDAAEAVADGVYPELVMISSKGYQTERTIRNAMSAIGSETRVLTLQNGMGNAEIIARYVPAERVFFGAASLAADAPGLGQIQDTTNFNRSPLVSIVPFTRQEDPFCTQLGELFGSMGYATDAGVAAEKFVWKKLCLNSCGNALAGIAQLSNYVYSNDQDGFILLSRLCAECVAVANACGIELDYDEQRAFTQATYYNQHHYVSMCQDMHYRRPTEIDTINGAIIREGRKHGVPTPVNETMYHLVRLISRHYDDQWKEEEGEQ